MGLGKRLDAGRYVFHTSIYLSVIGNDITKLASAKFGNRDQKTVRKSLQALVKDLRQQEPTVHEIVANSGSSNLIEYHRTLVTSAETHLTALDDDQTGRGDTWNPLYLAMRGWCERMKAVDLVANPKGGATTQALDLLWRYPSGEANADNPPVTESKPRSMTGTRRPTFAEALTAHFMGMQVEKKLLGKKFVRGAQMLSVCAFLFEQGAVLGSACRDRFQTFLVPFWPDIDTEIRTLLEQEAQRLVSLIHEMKSLHQLCVVDVMRGENPEASADLWAEWLLTKVDVRFAPEEAFRRGNIFAAVGAGFGAYYPAEFEALYAASYPSYPIEQRRAEVNVDFREFCSAYYPGLLNDLFG
jgi:hypothetical protein